MSLKFRVVFLHSQQQAAVLVLIFTYSNLLVNLLTYLIEDDTYIISLCVPTQVDRVCTLTTLDNETYESSQFLSRKFASVEVYLFCSCARDLVRFSCLQTAQL